MFHFSVFLFSFFGSFFVFFLFCSPERPAFKIDSFFLLFLFSLFTFVFPFRIPFFAFCHQPLLDNIMFFLGGGGGLFCLYILPFPLLCLFVYLKQTFLTSPCFTHVAFIFGCCFFIFCCFCCHGICLCPFCLYVVFVGMFSFVIVFFVCFMFCFQIVNKTFSLQF